MNPTIRAYRFWHIFTFFHNFLLKKQLLWRNRGDIHTFVSDAIYCRSAGKLTLYVSNVDILMKKKKSQPPKYFSWERKYFFVEILTWSHGSDRSVLQASNLHYRAEYLPRLYIPWRIQVSSVGDSGDASWDPHGDEKSQGMSLPSSQNRSDEIGSMK